MSFEMDTDLELLWLAAPRIGTQGVRELLREVHDLRHENNSRLNPYLYVPLTERITLESDQVKREETVQHPPALSRLKRFARPRH
jgi:hypothetical protein